MNATRRLIVELDVADYDALLSAAKRRGQTIGELAEKLLVECLASEVMEALLEENAS